MKNCTKIFTLTTLVIMSLLFSACNSTGVKGSVSLSKTPMADIPIELEPLELNASGIKKNTITDSQGKYAFTDILPGDYMLSIELDGKAGYKCVFMNGSVQINNGKMITMNLNINEDDLEGGALGVFGDFLRYCYLPK